MFPLFDYNFGFLQSRFIFLVIKPTKFYLIQFTVGFNEFVL